MAQASVLTVNNFPTGVDNTQHEVIVYGLVTFTGSGGYTTGGVPLNWNALINADGSSFSPQWLATKPFLAYFQPQDTSLVSYNFNAAGNTLFAIAAGIQVASGVTISGVIAFEAHFARGV
jgi:hypothetical protein